MFPPIGLNVNLDVCLNQLDRYEVDAVMPLFYVVVAHHEGHTVSIIEDPGDMLSGKCQIQTVEAVDGHESDLLREIRNSVRPDFFEGQIAEAISRFYKICKDLIKDYYKHIIEHIVLHISSHRGMDSGITCTPPNLAVLMDYLIFNIRPSRVFDPCAGLCNYVCQGASVRDGVQFVGMEVKYITKVIADIRLDAYGKNATVLKGDVEFDWNKGGECDVLASELPMGVLLNGHSKDTRRPVYIDDFVIDRFINTPSLTKAVLLVSLSTCYRNTNFDIRKTLCDKNYIDCVIKLPSRILPNTTASSAIIVLNKHRSSNDIKFVLADDCVMAQGEKVFLNFESVIYRLKSKIWSRGVEGVDQFFTISIDQTFGRQCSLNPADYIQNPIEVRPGQKIVEVQDVISFIQRDNRFLEREGHLAKISSLSSEGADCIRSVEFFEKTDNLSFSTKITEPVILLSSMGDLSPTYCEASKDNPLFISHNIIACRIKEDWVLPTYFCLELSKRFSSRAGANLHSISRVALMNTKLVFPSSDQQRSLEEQNNLYKEASEGLKLVKAKEMGLQEVIDRMKAEYMIEVRNRKHDMKTPMVQLRSTLKLLTLFSNALPKEKAVKLNIYIQRQKAALDTLSEIVKHLADEDKFAEPEILNIDDILSSFVADESYYSIKYWKDDVSFEEAGIRTPFVNMGRSDFMRIANNVISNAIEHGFTDKSGHYAINISTHIEDHYLRISFQNDGEPLPQEIDKERYGMRQVKGKDSKGQGTGGYVVKSIVEHYGGDYNVYVEKLEDGAELTFVDVKLPIFYEDEQIQDTLD